MNLNINVEYAVRERERLEIERRNITLRIAVWIRRCAALTTFHAALTREERARVNAERAIRAGQRLAHKSERVLAVVENDKPRETSMRTDKRPSARFKAVDEPEAIALAAEAGAVAGKRDATELDDNDSTAAWLEHHGSRRAPEARAAFVSAYSTAYDYAFASDDQLQLGEEVPNAI